jgi:hypothetical protein
MGTDLGPFVPDQKMRREAQPGGCPMFVVTLRAERGNPVPALRAVLKFALRRFGLRAISAYETTPQNQDQKTSDRRRRRRAEEKQTRRER